MATFQSSSTRLKVFWRNHVAQHESMLRLGASIADDIDAICRHFGWDLARLARETGHGRTYVSKVKHGHYPVSPKFASELGRMLDSRQKAERRARIKAQRLRSLALANEAKSGKRGERGKS